MYSYVIGEMCTKARLHIQFIQQFGFLFGPNIVPLWSKIFGPNIFPNFLLHRGTIFAPNKIPNRLTNWTCRRRLNASLSGVYTANFFDNLEFYLGQISSLYGANCLGNYLTQIFCFIKGQYLAQLKFQIVKQIRCVGATLRTWQP